MTSPRKKSVKPQEALAAVDLETCPFLTLAVGGEEAPFCATVRHLLLGSTVYFYLDKENPLCSLLLNRPKVCLCGAGFTKATASCDLPETQSALAFGEVEPVEKAEEHRQALFGIHSRHAVPENKQEAWMFSRSENRLVFKVKIDHMASN